MTKSSRLSDYSSRTRYTPAIFGVFAGARVGALFKLII